LLSGYLCCLGKFCHLVRYYYEIRREKHMHVDIYVYIYIDTTKQCPYLVNKGCATCSFSTEHKNQTSTDIKKLSLTTIKDHCPFDVSGLCYGNSPNRFESSGGRCYILITYMVMNQSSNFDWARCYGNSPIGLLIASTFSSIDFLKQVCKRK